MGKSAMVSGRRGFHSFCQCPPCSTKSLRGSCRCRRHATTGSLLSVRQGSLRASRCTSSVCMLASVAGHFANCVRDAAGCCLWMRISMGRHRTPYTSSMNASVTSVRCSGRVVSAERPMLAPPDTRGTHARETRRDGAQLATNGRAPSFRLALLLPDENNEKMIAVKSRGDHGPALLELFDVHTGTLKTKSWDLQSRMANRPGQHPGRNRHPADGIFLQGARPRESKA